MANSLYDRSLWEQQNRHAVHRFLGGDQCRRVALSEILDDPRHRRWCMDSDTACDICRAAHEEPIAPLQPREAAKGTLHTGLDIIQQQHIRAQDELYHYQHDLAAVAGTCIRCRAEGRARDHGFTSCSRRMDVIQQRTSSISRWRGAKHARKGWLAPYAACFWCLNPQTVCRRAETWLEASQGKMDVDGRRWLLQHFHREFDNMDAYFDWIGEGTQFGGGRAAQGVRIAAHRLREYSSEWLF
ncbi:hypothetical protein LTR91_018714 [Friedmanniomyces endolithicus]|uniref:Uncharacterized protein n=1 Tax=Friedmanniomyces endolithicus TaxID=329885 RepID=A0AAN6HB34_9PEZI|nr:hypothetical protein LTS01_024923 [Friedmanniomyces endolithicus]KAK0963999.1 hypothetical protein LTR91_018714 [Friedmanniomyces endolithicus]